MARISLLPVGHSEPARQVAVVELYLLKVKDMTDPASSRKLRVCVDLNLCQAYAQCCYAAPLYFRIEGREALLYDPAPTEAHWADIERARIACPVQAIRVEVPGREDA